jgi:hypothetical protein
MGGQFAGGFLTEGDMVGRGDRVAAKRRPAESGT